jgi:hypothetical protein
VIRTLVILLMTFSGSGRALCESRGRFRNFVDRNGYSSWRTAKSM